MHIHIYMYTHIHTHTHAHTHIIHSMDPKFSQNDDRMWNKS